MYRVVYCSKGMFHKYLLIISNNLLNEKLSDIKIFLLRRKGIFKLVTKRINRAQHGILNYIILIYNNNKKNISSCLLARASQL